MARLTVFWSDEQNPELDEPKGYMLDEVSIQKDDFLRYDKSTTYGDIYDLRDGRGVLTGYCQSGTVKLVKSITESLPNEIRYFWESSKVPDLDAPDLITAAGIPITPKHADWLKAFIYDAGPVNVIPNGRYLQVAFVHLDKATEAWKAQLYAKNS